METTTTRSTAANKDVIEGDSGADVLRGGSGDDKLFDYAQDPTGDDGADDQLYGGDDNDELTALKGNDFLSGDGGNDKLFGGDDNDTLQGGDGNDHLEGENGNDTLEGGAGSDGLIGGPGDDVLYGQNASDAGEDFSLDILEGDDGNDKLYGQGGADIMTGDAGDDLLYGGSGDDSLNGGDGIDQLYGEAGNDVVAGASGNDFLYGGDDNDKLYGNEGDDYIEAGLGNDLILGDTGNDLLVQSVDADQALSLTTVTGQGTDTFGGVERVWLFGGAGSNAFDVSGWNSGAAWIDGGGGTDRIVSANDTDFTLSDWNLAKTAGGSVSLASIEAATLTGGPLDNTFTLTDWSGTGVINGGAGNDVILASHLSTATLTATTLSRPSRGNVTIASVEIAQLTGDAGNNLLDASTFAGEARLYGGEGDDTLRGGLGDDYLDGGPGATPSRVEQATIICSLAAARVTRSTATRAMIFSKAPTREPICCAADRAMIGFMAMRATMLSSAAREMIFWTVARATISSAARRALIRSSAGSATTFCMPSTRPPPATTGRSIICMAIWAPAPMIRRGRRSALQWPWPRLSLWRRWRRSDYRRRGRHHRFWPRRGRQSRRFYASHADRTADTCAHDRRGDSGRDTAPGADDRGRWTEFASSATNGGVSGDAASRSNPASSPVIRLNTSPGRTIATAILRSMSPFTQSSGWQQ